MHFAVHMLNSVGSREIHINCRGIIGGSRQTLVRMATGRSPSTSGLARHHQSRVLLSRMLDLGSVVSVLDWFAAV